MLVMSQDGKRVVEITGYNFHVVRHEIFKQPDEWVIYCGCSSVEESEFARYLTEDRATAKLSEMFFNYEAGAKTYRFPGERKVV